MSNWGKFDRGSDRPKYANTDGDALYGNTYGVSVEEAVSTNTTAHGVHAGWVSGRSYSDVHGVTRYKFETLVAMSSIRGEEATVNTGNPLTGSVANISGNTVTGTGTSFNTELSVGESIKFGNTTIVSNGTFKVGVIANATMLELTVDDVPETYDGNNIFLVTDIRDDSFFKV